MSAKNATDGILASPACFRQRVVLPAAQVAGLSESELKAALAFEVEPFSGIPAAEGEMAWRPLEESDPSRRAYDVVQIRASDLAAAVARARAEKRRVVSVTAVPDEARGEVLADLPRLPVRAKGGLRAHGWAVWGAFCLLLLAAAAYDWSSRWDEVKGLRRDVAERQALQAEKESLEGRVDALRRQAGDIRRRRAEEASAQARAAVLRASGRVLLETVPVACRDESVVRGILSGEDVFDVRLTGVALSPEAAARTVNRLAQALAAGNGGWSVKPGCLGVEAAGDTCTFDCAFTFDPERSGR